MRVLSWDIGTKTLSYCLLEVTAEHQVCIHEWESIDVRKEAGLSDKAKPTMREDCELVLQAVSARAERFWNYQLDHITLEQQPAGGRNMFSSVRMKVVSHALHAYFFSQQLNRLHDLFCTAFVVELQLLARSVWCGLRTYRWRHRRRGTWPAIFTTSCSVAKALGVIIHFMSFVRMYT